MILVSLSETLQINQFIIAALTAQELMMRPALGDLALVEHIDDICLLDRT